MCFVELFALQLLFNAPDANAHTLNHISRSKFMSGRFVGGVCVAAAHSVRVR